MSADLVDNLTPKQTASLQQFREAVTDILKPYHDDSFLLRWISARQWNLKKAETMLRDSMIWREKEGADSILETYEPPEVLVKYFPGGLCGQDKEGSPIWLDYIGNCDSKGIMYSCSKKDIMRFKIHTMEQIYKELRDRSKQEKKRIDQILCIYDFKGFGLKHLWKPSMDMINEVFIMIEVNYPGTLKLCLIINAPMIFPIAFNLVKPFLQEETKKKIVILRSNWQEHLLSLVDADNLPQYWGGTLCDPDPYCSSKVCIGGEVPKSYYSKDANPIDLDSMAQATVGRGSSVQLDCEVTVPGSVIRWQFQTVENDVGFGIFRKTTASRQKAGEMEVLVESQRYNSHMVPEDGSVTVQLPGSYVVRFDNTYSWVVSKKVYYLIEVLPPDSSPPESPSKRQLSNPLKATNS